MFKKGDFVRARGTVCAHYGLKHFDEDPLRFLGKESNDRNLFRRKADFMGVVVGKSYRETGRRVAGCACGEEWLPAYLSNAERHPVWMVERLESERYFKPVPCREVDLELVDDS